jgi:hypothetical protein
LQVLAGRPLELLVILHVVIVRIDHELCKCACLAARCAAEHRSVGEGDGLRFLLIRLLHDELLRLASASCKNQCSHSGDYRKRFVSHFIFH